MIDKEITDFFQTASDMYKWKTYQTTTTTSCHAPEKEEFDFDLVVNTRLKLIQHLLLVKGKEYVRDDNPFHNFDVGAAFTGETPEDYLFGLVAKQIISIQDMINDLYEKKEPTVKHVEEKIGDAITYFILLEGLFKRRLNS